MQVIMDSQYNKGGCLGSNKENNEGYREILKMKIEGDECMSSNIMWAQKTPKLIDVWVARIQASAKAFILKNLHPSFIKFWLIISKTNTGYALWWNGGTPRNSLSKIKCIDQMTMSSSWVQLKGNDGTRLKHSRRRG